MAVIYSQNGVIVKNDSDLELVPYYPPSDKSIIVDSSGYIGSKKNAEENTYFTVIDSSSDYSQSGLGQVTLLDQLSPVDTLTINGHDYGVIQLDNWLIIDRNLSEPIGTQNTDYIVPDSGHASAGYFYKGASLYDVSTQDCTQLASDFLASVGNGWEFPSKDFRDHFVSKFDGYDSAYFRDESWYNGANVFGLNFVGARYSEGGSINYSASLIPCIYQTSVYWIAINRDGNVSFPVESGVFNYFNPRRLVKKLS